MTIAIWQKIRGILSVGRRGSSCHGEGLGIKGDGLIKLSIVGSPNVGKSVVFNSLTGAYVTVSNYPGTTVNVSRGKAKLDGETFEIMDTPGMYSLLPITEEERVARSILLTEKPTAILQVVDARNLERMLPITLQLIEAGLPIILDLNMMDEAEAAGIEVDVSRLETKLGIPVVATVATTGRGMEILRKRIVEYVRSQSCQNQV
ncbi:FeoB small GTPase domain-containing protein [Chloroflexota bacterium]